MFDPLPRPPRPPGDEPPPAVSSEILWRLAVRLLKEHVRGIAEHPRRGDCCVEDRAGCRSCGQPWPCSARRLAELGLAVAGRR